MSDTAIIYSSFAGKTRKIANYIAGKLNADIFDLKVQSNIDLSGFSRVIIGTGVHAGRPYSRVTKFIEDNRSELNDKEVVLFISCMYNGERAENQCSDITKDYDLSNSVFFSTRSEKNEAGLSKDVDVFIERMKS
jgi:menaquinone-dependent protoporphyrinogen oxidase